MIPKRFYWLLDLLTVVAAFVVTYSVWPHLYAGVRFASEHFGIQSALHGNYAGGPLPRFRQIAWIVAIAAPATILFLSLLNGHEAPIRQSVTRSVVAATGAPVGSAALLALVAFAIQREDVSRIFIFAFTLLSAAGLFALRAVLRAYLLRRRAAGFYAKNAVLVGESRAIVALLDHFSANVSPQEYRVHGYLSDAETTEGAVGTTLRDSGVLRLGRIADLGELLIHHPIHEVIAVQTAHGSGWLPKVIADCDSLGVLLRLIPEDLLFLAPRTLRILYPFQVLNLPAVVLAPPHFDSDALFFKRLIDIVVAAALLILLWPLFLIIAIAIKLSDHRLPVFYHWHVIGRNGVRFTGYKFTTMCIDADQRKKELMDRNEMTGPVFKIKEDPRVTPLGKFLRKYSLNELPQLWSVLKGDMSLVGPRPAGPHELPGYHFWHKRKLSIRPGMTCLWQVRGRNKISKFDDWVKLDLEYIDNWSLWLDFKILVRTAWVVVGGTGS